MESGESALQVISSVTRIVKGLKEAASILPVNTTLIPSSKNNMKQLQQQINELEKVINIGFPKLAQLVRSYSNLLSDVRVAWATSDKMVEIYNLSTIPNQFNNFFISDLNNNYTRISRILEQFTTLDVSERGVIDNILSNIRDQIRDLQNLDSNQQDKFPEKLKTISTQYSDMEKFLSKLLEKILRDFEQLGN